MKHNFKRVFALLLAVVMCLTCTLPVFASEGEGVACPGGSAAEHTDAYEAGTYTNATTVKEVEPACETTGYTVRQCNDCGVYFMTDIVEAVVGCDWGDNEWQVVTPATCTENGLQTKYCSVHDYTKKEVIPALGHDWTEWKADGALCVAGGTTESRTCNTCGETEQRDAVPADHAWGAPVFNKVPTCVDAGEATYTCGACGLTKTVKVLPMTDNFQHDWEVVESIPGSCVVESVNKLVCKLCGTEGEESLGFANHDFSVDVPEVPATCTSVGYAAHKKCSVCGERESGVQEYDKLPHTFTVFVSRVEAKCGVEGHTIWKCANCTETYKEVHAEQFGDHPWQVTPSAPTCSTYGHDLWFCPRCGEQKVEDVKEPYYHHLPTCEDHDACLKANNGIPCNMSDTGKGQLPTCLDAGTKIYACNECGVELTVKNSQGAGSGSHDFVEVIYEAANCVNGDGEKRWQCTICQAYETDAEGNIKTEVIELPAVDSEDYLKDEYHTVVIEIATPATCTLPGLKIKFCKHCDVYPKTEIPYTQAHEPLEGTLTIKDSDCVNPGSRTYTCKNCGQFITEVIDPKGHTPEDAWNVTTPADCVNPGLKVKYCAVCGAVVESEVIDPIGHDFEADEEPTLNCENQSAELTETCTVCGTTQGTGEFIELTPEDLHYASNHVCIQSGTAIENAEHHRPGRCDLIGLYSWICPNMPADSNTFYVEDNSTNQGHPTYNEDGTTKFLPTYIITVTPYVAPTCVSLGKTLAWSCPFCGATGGGEDIDYADHDLELVEAKNPTCTEWGNLEHYECKNLACLGIFVYDEDGELVEIALQDTALEPLDHDIKVVEIGATCTTNGEIKDVCQREGCGYFKVTANLPMTGHNYIVTDSSVVSCENIGYKHYECQNPMCVPEGEDDYGIREYIDGYRYALGHDWELVDKDCFEGDSYVCKNDATHTKVDAPRGQHTNAAGQVLTCEKNDEITDRVCADCGAYISDVHDYVNNPDALIKYHVDATCIKYGYTIWACPSCSWFEEVEDDIKTLGGHTEPAEFTIVTPADCENAGLKQKVCSVCKVHVFAEEEIPALGHNFAVYNTIVEADVLVEGYMVSECTRCGKQDQKNIPALDGMKFTYSYDNAVKSGYDFVNTGRIAVAVDFKTQGATLNSILLALEFDATILEFVEGEFTCDSAIFVDCEIGYDNALGKVSISAKVNTKNEENKDVTLADGESGLAILYFDVKASAGYTLDSANAADLGLTVVKSGDQSSSVVNKDAVSIESDVAGEEFAIIYGNIESPLLKRLGDVNKDGAVTDADAVLVLDYVFGEGYSAQADIDQNGTIDLDDYQLIKQFVISTITYEKLCAGEAV